MGHRNQNIPVEIFRTIIAVSETGSLTKASVKLGISQPAVSSQLKRIELIVGGSIFDKTANGSFPTALGNIVISNARKVIAANEQILALGGLSSVPSFVRVGLSSLLVREFIASQNAHASFREFQIVSNSSPAIANLLLDGKIDIACIFANANAKDISSLVVESFEVNLIWVRSKTFVLSPGSPIPIVSWSGDDWMARTLTQQGLAYRIAYNGEDIDAKISAVEAGLGIIALPERLLPPSLVHATEYYLPSLSSVKCLLCIQPDFRSKRTAEIRAILGRMFPYSVHKALT